MHEKVLPRPALQSSEAPDGRRSVSGGAVLLSKGLGEDAGLEGIMLSGISQTEKDKPCSTFGV